MGHRVEINAGQGIRALQRYEDETRIRRIVEMARHRAGAEPLDELQCIRVVDIDMIQSESVHGQILAIGTEPELIWIGDDFVAQLFSGGGIEEEQRVAGGIADQ